MSKTKKIEKPKIKGTKSLNKLELPEEVEIKTWKKKFFTKRVVYIALILFILILACLVLALLFEESIISNPFATFTAKTQIFSVEDRCSLIAGQLIHTLSNEEDCKVRCRTTCELRNTQFQNSEFLQKEKDCNICKCYCK
jgi:hypothetical protein